MAANSFLRKLVFFFLLSDVYCVTSSCLGSTSGIAQHTLLVGCDFMATNCGTVLEHSWCFVSQVNSVCHYSQLSGDLNITSARSDNAGEYVCCEATTDCCQRLQQPWNSIDKTTLKVIRNITVVARADLKCADNRCNVGIEQTEQQLKLVGNVAHDNTLERETIVNGSTEWEFLHPSDLTSFISASDRNLRNLGLSNVSIDSNSNSGYDSMQLIVRSENITLLNNTIFQLKVMRGSNSYGTNCARVLTEEYMYLNFTVTVIESDEPEITDSTRPPIGNITSLNVTNEAALSAGHFVAIAIAAIVIVVAVVLAGLGVVLFACYRRRRYHVESKEHSQSPSAQQHESYLTVDITRKKQTVSSVPPSTPSELLSLQDNCVDSDSDREIFPNIDEQFPIKC